MAANIRLSLGPTGNWHYSEAGRRFRPRADHMPDVSSAQFGVLNWLDATGESSLENAVFSEGSDHLDERGVPQPNNISAVPLLTAEFTGLKHIPCMLFSTDEKDQSIRSFDPTSSEAMEGLVKAFSTQKFRTENFFEETEVTEEINQQGFNTAVLQLSHTLPGSVINKNGNTPQAEIASEIANDIVSRLPKPIEGDHTPPPFAICGVIDDGLPFAHQNFKSSKDNTTRIDYMWLQAAKGAAEHRKNVQFGTELTGINIEKLLAKHGNDEEAIYLNPAIGAVSTDDDVGTNIMRNYTHGAHVMERAAGFMPHDKGWDERDRVRIIGVQLPRTALRDTAGFTKDSFILSGVHYVLGRAKDMIDAYVKANQNSLQDGKKIPVLINISLGTSGGPKDGTHTLERALDEVARMFNQSDTPMEVEIVLPSGNSFASRMYGESHWPEEGGYLDIPWQLQPNDRTSSILEVWLDGIEDFDQERAKQLFESTITPPIGFFDLDPQPDITGINYSYWDIKFGGETVGRLSLDQQSLRRWRLMIILAPTEHPTATCVPVGLYKIRLKMKNGDFQPGENDRIRCAIHRDEDPAGTENGGRQSYLNFSDGGLKGGLYKADGTRDPKMSVDEMSYRYQPVTNTGRPKASEDHPFITPFGSISGWATGTMKNPHRTSIGGFTATLNKKGDVIVDEAALYSGAGRRIGGASHALSEVSHSAVSNRNENMLGVVGAGTRSGSYTVLIGTSAAAPAYLRARMLDKLGLVGVISTGGVLPKDILFVRAVEPSTFFFTRPSPVPDI